MAPGERTASPSPKAYVKLQTPHKFFKVGRVFESDEELIYVVVREGYSSSTCCELQYVGQSSEITCSLPNIAALYLPDSPIKSPSDSQYQLKLECPRDEILPIYHFDFSKWLVLNHQIEVYKIGRVDRKSIKRLEAMFAALSTPSETITSTTVGSTELKSTRMERTEIEITEMKRTEMERNEVKRTEMESTAMERTEMEKPGVDSTEIEASTSKAAALFSTASYTNKTSSPAETSYDMTSISKRRSNNTVPTDWSGWEYNKDMGYVASRINKSGKEDPQYSGISSPPRMQTPPMESLWKDLRVALPLYENKVKGEEEISQEKGIKLAPGSHAEVSQDPTPSYNSYMAQYADLAFSHTPKPSISAHKYQEQIATGPQIQINALPRLKLWEEFKVHQSRHFKPGYLFKAVWTEPRGETISRQMESLSSFSRTTQSKYGELAYTSIRRFIIMASYEGHSICLPIYTYGGRGTAKSGVVPDHHAIIYSMRRRTSDRDPPRKSNGEQELVNAPIRIEPKSPRDVLHEMSRLNYAKAYTVEHNVKVAFIGRVHEDSKLTLQKDYLKIQGIPFSDNTSEPSGSNLDPNDGDNEALNGDDGTVSDIDVARANGARSESNEEVPEPELQPEPQPW